jgi:GNAT superfamily N-acetyltransferase
MPRLKTSTAVPCRNTIALRDWEWLQWPSQACRRRSMHQGVRPGTATRWWLGPWKRATMTHARTDGTRPRGAGLADLSGGSSRRSPGVSGVFGVSYDHEVAPDQTYWRSQLAAARRFVAEAGGSPCGVVSVGSFQQEPGSVELFGLWVDPTARSAGVAGRLVETAATQATAVGATQMYYWAGTENGPAIGFATGFGFRLTSHRRPATSGDHALGDTEIALVLALEDDPHIVPNAAAGRFLR